MSVVGESARAIEIPFTSRDSSDVLARVTSHDSADVLARVTSHDSADPPPDAIARVKPFTSRAHGCFRRALRPRDDRRRRPSPVVDKAATSTTDRSRARDFTPRALGNTSRAHPW